MTSDMKSNYCFVEKFKVRDYECDLQGVVNHANYIHYMEHARHEFLESLGDNFSKMHDAGLDAFVVKVDVDYKQSMRSGDNFIVGIRVERKGPKCIFYQDVLSPDRKIVYAKGQVHVALVKDGVLTRGVFFDELLKDYL